VQTQYWTTAPTCNRLDTLASHQLIVERVISYIRDNVQEALSLDDLADIACLSPYYFSRIFHNLVGIPPGEFLAALRLNAAKRLLLTTSLTVTDICFEVGYSGLGSFTTRFSQQIGVSPRLLRNLAQEHLVFSPLELELAEMTLPTSPCKNSLTGHIFLPHTFKGLIFAGLFPKPIPQGRPVRCTMLTAPGSYHIDRIPPGRYYLMVAAFPLSNNPQTYLLPDATLMVGSSGPLTICQNAIPEPVDLLLRPLRSTDPPILSALPYI
jgi:AraC family transcriptional regulator